MITTSQVWWLISVAEGQLNLEALRNCQRTKMPVYWPDHEAQNNTEVVHCLQEVYVDGTE